MTVTLRAATRSLRRAPGFAVLTLVLLTLALGLATTTISVVIGILHPHLPFRDPSSLYEIDVRTLGRPPTPKPIEYLAVRSDRQLYSEIAEFTSDPTRPEVSVNGVATHADAWVVTANYFDLLGLPMYLGRGFYKEDAVNPEGAGVVVSFIFWARHLARVRDLTHVSVTIDGHTRPVIGVLLPSSGTFLLPFPGMDRVLVPMSRSQTRAPTKRLGSVIVMRLRTGQTAGTAARELAALQAKLNSEYGRPWVQLHGWSVATGPGNRWLDRFHIALIVAVMAVVLIACANVANMFAARLLRRRREFATRAALGASSHQLRSLVFAEAGLLCLLGGIGGLVAAGVTGGLMRHRVSTELIALGMSTPALDWRVFVCAGASSAVVLLVVASIAIRQAGVNDLYYQSARGDARPRRALPSLQNGLIAGQVAMALVVMVFAGLLILAAHAIRSYPFGFNPQGITVFDARAPRADSTVAALDNLYGEILRGLADMPGVDAAATTYTLAISGGAAIALGSPAPAHQVPVWSYQVVSPNFFGVVGITPSAGRDFGPGDEAVGGVAIVDESVSHTLWGRDSAVGQWVRLGSAKSAAPVVRVVGVVPDIRFDFAPIAEAVTQPTRGIYVIPAPSQVDISSSSRRSILLRTPTQHPAAVKRAGRDMAVRLGYEPIASSFLSPYSTELAMRKYLAGVFSALAAFALILSTIGLHGILSYSMGHRRREFAVRLAMGARPRDVVKIVATLGATVVIGGMAIGSLVSLWTSQALKHWLFTVNPMDVRALLAAEVILVVVSAVAVIGPAIRAAYVDPVELMRVE
ncbi:MAG TPA: FtsX-like permease family protein [Gemmatimonadaceae bacterium]|jgi:predicted permease|nr:FtsX-like permease family protein [Gemmatimonadaceae bacterium]